ncbi:ADP-ribosylation factor-like protein 6-interacting protein 4 [Phlebotomus argentipes]|uniref:ADP-ribosylation factor-like protein 6-interacting protein 4 n=1 Tax=Phlebotomus argentipes TaxID=94469 RepID=UPI00289315EC|nr:ADP-ribosylation factor-like protein 6-interacting protein 4 [Phlebotomus argentipes]
MDYPGGSGGAGWSVDRHKKLKKHKHKDHKKHKRRSSSSSSCSSSSDSSSGRKMSKEMKKARKEQKKLQKKLKKEAKKGHTNYDIPINLMTNTARVPETREQWEARQSVIRRVTDPVTGRERLIRGDGEVLEEIVSRDRHREINRQATAADGQHFQANTIGWKLN